LLARLCFPFRIPNCFKSRACSGREARKVTLQAGLLLPEPKTIRGEAAPLGRKEAVPSRTEGIPSWAEGNPSQSEGNPSRAEGNPSPAEGITNVCPSVKSKYFNGLRSTPAGGSGIAPSPTAQSKPGRSRPLAQQAASVKTFATIAVRPRCAPSSPQRLGHAIERPPRLGRGRQPAPVLRHAVVLLHICPLNPRDAHTHC
jgi:hypothetical protein